MSGRLSFFRDGTVHLSSGDAVAAHATPSWKVVVSLDAPMELTVGDRRSLAQVLVVPPHAAQAIRARGVTVAYLAEPGSALAPFPCADSRASTGQSGLWQPGSKQRSALLHVSRELLLGRPADDPARTAEVFGLLALSRTKPDARVVAALCAAAQNPDLDLSALALAQRVSPVRLRHLVQLHAGITLRTHKLWHRTLHAVELLLQGSSIAASAAGAGFADHAHFTRSFVRFVGRTPSSIAGETRVLSSYAARADRSAARRTEPRVR
jgi:AraC-like DNA-binding protein